jgi:hypothetical protein
MTEMKPIFLFLSLFLLSCNNPNVSKPLVALPLLPDHALAKKRLPAKTLTDFLAIGYQLDTVAKNYASLKYDSIEAINYLNIGMARLKKGESIDTILKRHVLNIQQVEHLVQVLDNEKTYDFENRSLCFEPHLTFVFYSKDTIISRCSVCFDCKNIYSAIKSEKINGMNSLTKFGDQMLSKLCSELNFSDCKRD